MILLPKVLLLKRVVNVLYEVVPPKLLRIKGVSQR